MFARAAVVAKRSVVKRQQVRGMAGGHGHVEYTGFEKTVRDVLPEDHQIVLAVLGITFGLVGLFKLKPSKKKAPEPVVEAAPAAAASSEIPSVLDANFEEWSKTPGNVEKYANSIESWANSLK